MHIVAPPASGIYIGYLFPEIYSANLPFYICIGTCCSLPSSEPQLNRLLTSAASELISSVISFYSINTKLFGSVLSKLDSERVLSKLPYKRLQRVTILIQLFVLVAMWGLHGF